MTSETQAPQVLTISPRLEHTATVIFIHGLGDSGYGWLPVAEMYAADPDFDSVKWVLPHASRRPVTANNGYTMPAWFDILESGNEARQDVDGILASTRAIDSLVQAEARTTRRVVLGGFSQGAALAIIAGLSTKTRLAGVAALSGRVMVRDRLKSMVSLHAKELPVFVGHGTDDPLVRPEHVLDGVEFLKNEIGLSEAAGAGTPGISLHTYDGLAHVVSERELEDLRNWLKVVVSAV
ncbi:lysophospholipase I [Vararia minispora EC-137]|uniref:Lysophospholipase I n=1 Tax=Vararia minispora EC-137 TaxID=1314806 RepID=A0ACB8QMZ6_9AGAM|nr:lysophospholipase I [Vararia minispora EC-137]